jgi:DNA-binding NarL/FixJ family response regulator
MSSQTGTNIKLIKIWLVDDHLVYRESFKNLIESFDPAFKVIKLAENSKEVLELLRKYYYTELKPDNLSSG